MHQPTASHTMHTTCTVLMSLTGRVAVAVMAVPAVVAEYWGS